MKAGRDDFNKSSSTHWRYALSNMLARANSFLTEDRGSEVSIPAGEGEMNSEVVLELDQETVAGGSNESDSEQVLFNVILPAEWWSEKRYAKTPF